MSIYFKADEIFEIAERIEANGARFYRKAAQNLNVPKVSKLLNDLAAMEDEHLATFHAMRKSLTESSSQVTLDPDEELLGDYLNAWADSNVFKVTADDKALTGEESLEEILRLAVNAEKEAIVFYLGMKKGIRGDDERSKIEVIINEEVDHYMLLNRELQKLEGMEN